MKKINLENELKKADEYDLLDEWGTIFVLWEYNTIPANYEETRHYDVKSVKMVALCPNPNFPDRDAEDITHRYDPQFLEELEQIINE